MKNYIVRGICFCWFALFATPVFSQSDSLKKNSDDIGSLKINFDPSGQKYMQIGIWNQTWLRYIDNNPGTLVNGEPERGTYDAGIRRMRISTLAQLSPKFLMFYQIGFNNQTFISGGGSGTGAQGNGKKATVFFHDAYGEYTLIPELDTETKKKNNFSLYLGAGLHSWNGVSRLTNASSSKMLTADLPVYNFPTIEISDQMSRQFGVFVHGSYKKFTYRMNVNKPFATNNEPKIGNTAVDNNKGDVSFAGYYSYQFFETESQKTPFLAGTYLGSKKILNIGAGFYSSKNGTKTQPSEGVYENHDIRVLGVDIFSELPLTDDTYLSVYSVYYNYQFGPNYLRTTALLNPGTPDPSYTGQTALEGAGNGRVLLGTGSIWHTQLAYMLPRFSKSVQIQPYITYARKSMEALNETGNYYDFGTNFYFVGHNAKVSLQYSSRPLYDTETKTVFKHAGEVLIAMQFFL